MVITIRNAYFRDYEAIARLVVQAYPSYVDN